MSTVVEVPWKVRRRQQEWTIATIAEVRLCAMDGRIVESDYIFNPTLERWMYAREVAELDGIFAPTRARVKADEYNRASWVMVLLSIIVGIFAPALGGVLFVAAVVLAILSHATRPRSIDSSGAYVQVERETARQPTTSKDVMIGIIVAGGFGVLMFLLFALPQLRSDADPAKQSEPATFTPNVPTPDTTSMQTISLTESSSASSTTQESVPQPVEESTAEVKRDARFAAGDAYNVRRRLEADMASTPIWIDRTAYVYHVAGCPDINSETMTRAYFATLMGRSTYKAHSCVPTGLANVTQGTGEQ